jgi:hypothetical protein
VQSARRSVAVRRDFVPRQTHDAVAGELQIGVARRVSFTVATGAVVGEAVELYHEAMGRPDGVDFVDVLVALE